MRMELRAAHRKVHEVEMRKIVGMEAYSCEAGRTGLDEEGRRLYSALKDVDLKRMAHDVEKAEAQLEGLKVPPGISPAKPPEALAPDVEKAGAAAWVAGGHGERTMLVPTRSTMEDMFAPEFWTAMDPRCFVYGDGVFGIERDSKLTYAEYVRYLLNRDELEYSSMHDELAPGGQPVSAAQHGAQDHDESCKVAKAATNGRHGELAAAGGREQSLPQQ